MIALRSIPREEDVGFSDYTLSDKPNSQSSQNEINLGRGFALLNGHDPGPTDSGFFG